MTSKQQQWRTPLKKPVDSGKTFVDISVNTDHIGTGFKADVSFFCNFQTKIWLKSNLLAIDFQIKKSITF